jgi:hypothetical protein
MPVHPGMLRGGASASLTLAGQHIYALGNQGTTVIFEPGRTFKQLAKLRLENLIQYPIFRQEATISNPIFEGERMYLRSEYALYCIGK